MHARVPRIGLLPLAPVLHERVWGSLSLRPWLETSGPEKRVGEAWLTSLECRISSGPWQGSTLAEALATQTTLGEVPPCKTCAGSAFPLLIKLLFPTEKLSVQVHPDDRQAQAVGQPCGKTECWYVLSADAGATVAVGLKRMLTSSQLVSAIEGNTLETELVHLPVKSGDLIHVAAGTVHAIGPGVVILEIQQYSDTTYRLYDYGRPRDLHIEQGLAVVQHGRGGHVPSSEKSDCTELIRCQHFGVDRFHIATSAGFSLPSTTDLQIVVALDDGCSIQSDDGSSFLVLRKAEAVIVPGEGIGYRVEGPMGSRVIRVSP